MARSSPRPFESPAPGSHHRQRAFSRKGTDMPVTFRAGARGRGRKVAPDAGRLGQAVLVLRNRVDFPTRFSGPFGARRRVRNSGSGQGGSIHSSSSCSSSRRSVAFLESKLACFHFCSRILSRARLGAGAWAPLRSGPARLGWTSPQVMDRRYPSISYIRGLEICMSKNPRGIEFFQRDSSNPTSC